VRIASSCFLDLLRATYNFWRRERQTTHTIICRVGFLARDKFLLFPPIDLYFAAQWGLNKFEMPEIEDGFSFLVGDAAMIECWTSWLTPVRLSPTEKRVRGLGPKDAMARISIPCKLLVLFPLIWTWKETDGRFDGSW
jgi:hypothetical protein